MGTLPETSTDATQEIAYRTTTDPVARRQIQAAVVKAYRSRVRSYVRRRMAPRHWEEAEQVGSIGVLVALEKFESGRMGVDRGAAFWRFAFLYVRHEIQRWVSSGVHWRPSTRHAKNRKFYAEHLVHVSMDESYGNEREDSTGTRHDVLFDDVAETVEDLVATAEGLDRVGSFVSKLNNEDAKLLLNGVGFGRGRENSPRARRYLTLIERLRTFVRGS